MREVKIRFFSFSFFQFIFEILTEAGRFIILWISKGGRGSWHRSYVSVLLASYKVGLFWTELMCSSFITIKRWGFQMSTFGEISAMSNEERLPNLTCKFTVYSFIWYVIYDVDYIIFLICIYPSSSLVLQNLKHKTWYVIARWK